ncbi:MAG: DUF349 domain-containing protein [Bacteroidales bacterium]|nr:DUF349 domain-containing protein [Bacteroidales bacterium]
MSEELKPEVISQEEAADVAQEQAAPQEKAAEEAGNAAEQAEKVPEIKEEIVNLVGKSLSELSEMMSSLVESVDRMKRSKEAEAIKSAFYRLLSKEKADAGYGDGLVDEPSDRQIEQEVESGETAESVQGGDNPFAAVEAAFKELYNKFKKEKAEFNRELESQREENLAAKLAIIEELKALVESQDEMKDAFPKFRDIQARWREIGPVPQQNYRDVNDTYQLYVEKFYDLVQINRDLRDLDFRKNLEAKEEFCRQAEELAASEDCVTAFKELQKLHEQWKELGPVAKEFRDAIWERFKAATAVINRKYQAHFEEQKARQNENLAAKTALCEKMEEIASREITSSAEWNAVSKEIEALQAQWRTIGFATRKENQRIYERFRAACDKFFERKREFYAGFKDSMNENMERKMAIIEEAEQLATSTDWKATSARLIELQKLWKEIGAVPRKKSEQMWKRFRAACDVFFTERAKAMKSAGERAVARASRAVKSEKEVLVKKFTQLQQDIQTYENNIGFFSVSKASEGLVKQMQAKIDAAKQELEALKAKIRAAEAKENEE